MIDLASLRPWLRHTIQVLYAMYATSISIFVLVIAVLAIFSIFDVEIKAAEMGAFGLALLAPLVPFVHKIVLPGGGGFDWPEPKNNQVLETVTRGASDTLSRIDELDLNEIAIVGESTEGSNG